MVILITSLICITVIDFVAPYFDQSGISILLRKKKRETNVFKFLSVLKPEVCLRILKSIVHTTLYYRLMVCYNPFHIITKCVDRCGLEFLVRWQLFQFYFGPWIAFLPIPTTITSKS